MKKVIYILVCLLFIFPFVVPARVGAETRHELGIATSASLVGVSDNDLELRLSDIKNLGTDSGCDTVVTCTS